MAIKAEYSPRLKPAARAGCAFSLTLKASKAAMLAVSIAGWEMPVGFRFSCGPSNKSFLKSRFRMSQFLSKIALLYVNASNKYLPNPTY